MGERKYLVVPKHSIVSVSPTIGAALNTPSIRTNVSPTADKPPTNLISDDDKILNHPSPTSASLGPTEMQIDQNENKENTRIPDPTNDPVNTLPDIPATTTSDTTTSEQSKPEEIITQQKTTENTKE